jgi:hypothetical protein
LKRGPFAVTAKFVRFVTFDFDEVTGAPVGFFKKAYSFWRRASLPDQDDHELRELLDWFRDSLEAPNRLHRSANRHAHGKGLSWFTPEAVEHIAKARRILALLEKHTAPTRMVTAINPGYILYEDEFQVCAIPFRDGDGSA